MIDQTIDKQQGLNIYTKLFSLSTGAVADPGYFPRPYIRQVASGHKVLALFSYMKLQVVDEARGSVSASSEARGSSGDETGLCRGHRHIRADQQR